MWVDISDISILHHATFPGLQAPRDVEWILLQIPYKRTDKVSKQAMDEA